MDKYFSFMLVMIIITVGVSFCAFIYGTSIGHKSGYEEAVEDFFHGKLKCERVENKKVEYIWEK